MKINALFKNKIKKLVNNIQKELEDTQIVEFDMYREKDANSENYYAIYLKNMNHGVKTVKDNIICFLKKHKVQFGFSLIDSYKTIIWIPVSKKIKYLIEDRDFIVPILE